MNDMTWLHEEVLGAIFGVAGVVLAIGILFTIWRLTRGPTLCDRVVALDLLGFQAVGVIALFAIVTQRPVLLSVGIVMALVLFLATAAFAMYLERRARP